MHDTQINGWKGFPTTLDKIKQENIQVWNICIYKLKFKLKVSQNVWRQSANSKFN